MDKINISPKVKEEGSVYCKPTETVIAGGELFINGNSYPTASYVANDHLGVNAIIDGEVRNGSQEDAFGVLIANRPERVFVSPETIDTVSLLPNGWLCMLPLIRNPILLNYKTGEQKILTDIKFTTTVNTKPVLDQTTNLLYILSGGAKKLFVYNLKTGKTTTIGIDDGHKYQGMAVIAGTVFLASSSGSKRLRVQNLTGPPGYIDLPLNKEKKGAEYNGIIKLPNNTLMLFSLESSMAVIVNPATRTSVMIPLPAEGEVDKTNKYGACLLSDGTVFIVPPGDNYFRIVDPVKGKVIKKIPRPTKLKVSWVSPIPISNDEVVCYREYRKRHG